MDLQSIIIAIVIGGIAGWLASIIMKKSNSLLMNIILGIVGGFVGNFLLGQIGIDFHGPIGQTIAAVIGSCIVLAIFNLIKKK